MISGSSFCLRLKPPETSCCAFAIYEWHCLNSKPETIERMSKMSTTFVSFAYPFNEIYIQLVVCLGSCQVWLAQHNHRNHVILCVTRVEALLPHDLLSCSSDLLSELILYKKGAL